MSHGDCNHVDCNHVAADRSGAQAPLRVPEPRQREGGTSRRRGVTVMALLVAVLGWGWILIPLTYGFLARVLTGPTLSPLGRFAVDVAAPRLGEPRLTPGPPKRFAQGIGVVFTVTASVLWLAGAPAAARVVVAMLAAAAFLEAAFGFCLGCRIFALLMRLGVIPRRCARSATTFRCESLAGRQAELSRRLLPLLRTPPSHPRR
ncbi:MAG: DUF4395 domain-containing protein [Microthrixaceae bacterium]|nr:DUF4395 domain-containing protein [Microthrixaceae bacterium]